MPGFQRATPFPMGPPGERIIFGESNDDDGEFIGELRIGENGGC